MSRRLLTWNEQKYKKYIKEGRGSGLGKDYKPWIRIQNFPSMGKASRISGWKTNRVHHLLSGNETNMFYFLEWSDFVIDIREQFPILDYKETVKIADNLGIKHPIDNESRFPYILTTDFMITINVNGKVVNIARTIKPAGELDKPRVIEKLEIERRYWKNQNVDWKLIADNDISKVLARNIESLHSFYKLEDTDQALLEKMNQIKCIINEKALLNSMTIPELGGHIDIEMKLTKGTGLYIIKHLISRKEIFIDVTKEINYDVVASKVITGIKYKDIKGVI